MNHYLRIASLLILSGICGWICACKKEAACYDAALQQQYHTISCTLDCPGVVGCDGKTYCNECIANSKGIRIRK